jgi:hypothetical protein
LKKTNQYQKGESSMTPHPYVYEKLIASRQTQIQHEMQQINMLAHLNQRRTFVQLTVGKLGKALIVLGSYMQRTGQPKKASAPSA